MPCGHCGKLGHNRRTCVSLDVDLKDVLQGQVEECIICYGEVLLGEKGSVNTECGHVYCTKCFVDHMRRSNKCGICRRDVSAPITKKTLSQDEINGLVQDSVLNEATFRMIYTDFYTQIRRNILWQNQQVINSRDKELINIVCTNILREVTLDYCIWLAGVTVAQRVSLEYER